MGQEGSLPLQRAKFTVWGQRDSEQATGRRGQRQVQRAPGCTSRTMRFLSHTYLPVRWSSGPPCPPCSSDSPRSVTPLGTGGIFRFSCEVKITVSQLSVIMRTITSVSCTEISTESPDVTLISNKAQSQTSDPLCVNLAYYDSEFISITI